MRTRRVGQRDPVRAFQLLDQQVVDRAARRARRSRRATSGTRARSPTNASGDSVHHQWKSSPPSPQSRRFHSRSRDVTWPFSSVECSSRIGTCQHTLGFQSSGRSPASSAAMCSAQPAPPAKPGPVEEDAGVVDEPGDGRPSTPSSLGSPGRRNPPRRALAWNCIWSGRRRTNACDDVGDVVLVDEVGAVAAAALLELRAPARRGSRGSRRRRCTGSSSAGTWRRRPRSAARRDPRS